MRKFCFFIIQIFILTLTTSCSGSKNQKKEQILVSIPSYEKILQSALGDRYEVLCVVPEGFNPHYFEVKPSDLKKIQNPRYFFGIHESFEPKLLETLQSRFPEISYYDLLESVPYNELESENECHHNHAHHHHHGLDDVDNHLWLNPRLMKLQLEYIKKKISNLSTQEDSSFKAVFNQLDVLDENLKESFIPMQGKAILVSHPSFGYFCKEYGLVQISIECEGKQPMPKDLENLAQRLNQSPILCVLAQAQFDQKGAVLIAKKLNKPIYSIDPYSKNYFEMLTELKNKIREAYDTN